MKWLCFHGPESTGKTTLAKELAQRFGTVWVPEYLRGYLDNKGADCEISDMPLVAHGHRQAVLEAEQRANGVLILDTDTLTTQLYHRFYYGEDPSWYEPLIVARPADLYLLCKPDIPWVADGQRDMPHRREELWALFKDQLESRGLPYRDISGDFATRLAAASEAFISLTL